MRTPSRSMPPPRRAGPVGIAIGCTLLSALLGGVTWGLAWLWWPLSVAFVATVVAVEVAGRRRAKRIAAERSGESICEFARSFERRSVDPWILRATYERLVATCGFPVRADDRFEGDLRIGGEDVDFEAIEIAERSGRSLEGAEANPRCGKVETVRDLVLFFDGQPRVQTSRGSSKKARGAIDDVGSRDAHRG